MIENNDDDFDMGINPKEIFSSKNWFSKAFLSMNDAVNMSVIRAVQDTDYEKGDVVADFVQYLCLFSGSVKGEKIKHYGETGRARIAANDHQTKINIEGQK